MTEAEREVRRRWGEAPPRLVEAMVRALPAEAGPDLPETLAEAALALYGALAGGGERRADALPLLAADALLTHALETAAQADPDSVAERARRWGAAGRLGELAAKLPAPPPAV